MSQQSRRSVGLAGLGSIGIQIATALDRGFEGFSLERLAVRDRARAAARMADFRSPPAFVELAELAECDIVIEALPSAAFEAVVAPALQRGRTVIIASSGALLERPYLIEMARRHGGRLVVPSGALAGLDAVRAVTHGAVDEVLIQTRKPPAGLVGAPYLVVNGIDLHDLAEPRCIFTGSAREAAVAFPANTNVAAALALAGVGPDRTRVEVWADPTLTRNTHHVRVRAQAANVDVRIEIVPNTENPRSGRLTPLSILASLRALYAPLVVGV
jgi:aspartate dehydrogenase